MHIDPIIDEVRETRETHAAKFDFDVQAIYRDIKRKEAESDRNYINFPPRKLEP